MKPVHAPELKLEISRVWLVAWPLILTNMMNVSVGIIDFKMVGVLGVAPIAAVGMARQVIMFLMVVMLAISGGSSVLVAHAYGAGERRRVGEIAARSVFLMLLLAVFIVTPMGLILSGPILHLLRGSETVVRLGISYLNILFWGSVFTMFNFAVIGILLGVGKTKISLILLMGINILNVIFNYIFIFGAGPVPAFGVAGAAIGTVVARAIGSLAGFWILTSPRFPVGAKVKDALSFDLGLLRRLIYLGGPRSLQGVVRNFSRLMTLWIINLLPDSTQAVSAYSVGMQVRLISSFIGLAFMSASMSRVGQNIGAGDREMAEKSGWISAAMAVALMSVFTVIFLIFPESIMKFFTDDREVIEMGRTFFLTIALTEPVMAFAFALTGALRAGGDPISPFVYGSISDLVVVIVMGYVLAVVLQFGFVGIAIAIAISAVTRAVPVTWKFSTGQWKKIEI